MTAAPIGRRRRRRRPSATIRRYGAVAPGAMAAPAGPAAAVRAERGIHTAIREPADRQSATWPMGRVAQGADDARVARGGDGIREETGMRKLMMRWMVFAGAMGTLLLAGGAGGARVH